MSSPGEHSRRSNRTYPPSSSRGKYSSSTFSQNRCSNSRFLSPSQIERWVENQLPLPANNLISYLSSYEGLHMLTQIADSRSLSPEIVVKLTKLVTQDGVRMSVQRENTNKIYGAFMGSAILMQIQAYIRAMARPRANDVWPFVHFFQEMQSRTVDGWMFVPVDAVREAVDAIPEGAERGQLYQHVLQLLEQRNKLKTLSHTAKSESSTQVQRSNPRTLAIIPSEEEICSNRLKKLPINRVGENYGSMDEYLSTHFELLREDCFASLKHAIRGIRQKLVPDNIKRYTQVKLTQIECGDQGVEHCISFKVTKNKAINWSASKRLMTGSLVCISCDGFSSYGWGIVKRRDDRCLQKGQVVLQLIPSNEGKVADLMKDISYEMIESAVSYFEAYGHVLKCLQRPEMEGLPFCEHFLSLDPHVMEPSYLSNRRTYDFRCAFPDIQICLGRSNINVLQQPWPQWKSSLDESQMEAVKQGLTKRLAIIQGPPGTGKTYVGLKIVTILLSNVNCGPILVICYTNHALDQFLEFIYSIEKNIVRLGGRSTDENMSKLSLKEHKRRSGSFPRSLRFRQRELTGQRDLLQAQIQCCLKVLRSQYVSKHMLQGVASEQHIQSLFSGDGVLSKSTVETWAEEIKYPEPVAVQNPRYAGKGKKNAESDMPFSVRDRVSRKSTVETWLEEIKDPELVAVQKPSQGKGKKNAESDMPVNTCNAFSSLVLDEEKKNEEPNSRSATPANGTGNECLESDHEENKCNNSQTEGPPITIPMECSLDEILNSENLWLLPKNSRKKIHSYWLDQIQQKAKEELHQLCERYKQVCDGLREIDRETDLSILRNTKVVGMTTTQAAKSYDMLQSLRAEIVVIEEAAEVLEANILPCIGSFTKHLILLGDHLQLRPSVAVYELAIKHKLEISLFERLIGGEVDHVTLRCQRRMRPSISTLISDIYPSLQDHDSVKEYENIKGIKSNVFFLDHRAPEARISDASSKVNIAEARLVVEFCIYLLRQGYKHSDITILTMYKGQMSEIQKFLKERIYRDKDFEQKENAVNGSGRDSPRVSSVDNYQGEECNIIILSLVRSNKDIGIGGSRGNIGFLKVSNRVCVALSRAKMGLYIFGNGELLGSKSSLWESIIGKLRLSDCIGPKLTLACQNHPRTETKVSAAEDFRQVEDGGCSKPCESQLKCGHACPRRCHPSNHDRIICSKPCPWKFEASCGHRCTKLCHFPTECPPCETPVPKVLPQCGHGIILPCSAAIEDAICHEPCSKTLDCGHPCRSMCGRPCRPCMVRVPKDLPCGHRAKLACSTDIATFSCQKPCGQILSPGCAHKCAGTCGSCKQGTSHIPCEQKCSRPLPCGHECLAGCMEICPPCTRPCEKRCLHSRCILMCGALCRPCMEECEWKCKHHTCDLLCHEVCLRPRCNEPCTLTLRCGHPCIGLCGDPCPQMCRICNPKHLDIISQMTLDEYESSDRFVELLDCGHVFEVSGLDTWMDMDDNVQGAQPGAVAIKLKQCPECRTPIRRTLRYSNVVKMKLQQIEEVKKRIFGFENVKEGNNMLKKKAYKKALEKFELALNGNPMNLDAHFGKARALCGLKDHKQAIQHLSFVIERSSYKSILVETLPSLMSSSPLRHNTMQTSKAKDELAINALLQWASACSAQNDFSNALAICDVILKQHPLHAKALEMKDRLRNGEMQQVVEVVTREVGGRGHWYQCPNGHFYVVGECGGPMQTSRCPDCNAVVGGQSHRPAEGNTHANIDGSDHPAWSNATGIGDLLP
eukprot:Gb_08232 [translate_table: standard]